MPEPWVPLVKREEEQEELFEYFGNASEASNRQTSAIVALVLLVVGVIILGMLYWAYVKDVNMFVGVFATLMALVCMKMLILIAIMRKRLTHTVFSLYLGTAIMMFLICSGIATVFFLKLGGSEDNVNYYAPAETAPVPAAPAPANG